MTVRHHHAHRRRARRAICVVSGIWALGLMTPAAGQTPPDLPGADGWNHPRALELIDRARTARSSAAVDSAFRSYRAEARGYVYFFLDRPDDPERTLLKADQIALEVYWSAPDRTRQRIVGLRDQRVLPTNIHYHLDHLTVVQDDFGDWIRMGDGDEVERVLHPAGPASDVMYDFRIADSLSIRYGTDDDEVRVYEVRVRPKTPSLPGFIGSVFLARDDAAIVRMTFTFTPESYVDPYLDYIRVSLDNSLWDGRYWLPYRQEVEIRRELPALDFLAGSVIRGRFEIGAYTFNAELDDGFFLGRGVTSVPEQQRRAFPFERGLFDDLEQEGLAPIPSLEEVRRQARQVVTNRALSGLAPVRMSLGSASDALRYNRAEGLVLGGGLSLRPARGGVVRVLGGYAFGRERLTARADVQATDELLTVDVSTYWDAIRDLGPLPAASTAVNSLYAAVGHADYLDPWLARGMSATLRTAPPGAGPEVRLRWEDQRSAANVLDGDLGPVLPIREGIMGSLALRVPLRAAGSHGWVEGTVARLGSADFAGVAAGVTWRGGGEQGATTLQVDLNAGALAGDAPVQSLYHVGGRGTVPGHPFRSLQGPTFGLVRAAASHPVRGPWVGVRVLAAAGAVRLGDPSAPPAWAERVTGRTAIASLGGGLSLLWDVVRVDLNRGLGDGGSWAWVVSITPRFTPWL